MKKNSIGSYISRQVLDKDPIWHIQVTILFALLLQLVLPDKFVAGNFREVDRSHA